MAVLMNNYLDYIVVIAYWELFQTPVYMDEIIIIRNITQYKHGSGG